MAKIDNQLSALDAQIKALLEARAVLEDKKSSHEKALDAARASNDYTLAGELIAKLNEMTAATGSLSLFAVRISEGKLLLVEKDVEVAPTELPRAPRAVVTAERKESSGEPRQQGDRRESFDMKRLAGLVVISVPPQGELPIAERQVFAARVTADGEAYPLTVIDGVVLVNEWSGVIPHYHTNGNAKELKYGECYPSVSAFTMSTRKHFNAEYGSVNNSMLKVCVAPVYSEGGDILLGDTKPISLQKHIDALLAEPNF